MLRAASLLVILALLAPTAAASTHIQTASYVAAGFGIDALLATTSISPSALHVDDFFGHDQTVGTAFESPPATTFTLGFAATAVSVIATDNVQGNHPALGVCIVTQSARTCDWVSLGTYNARGVYPAGTKVEVEVYWIGMRTLSSTPVFGTMGTLTLTSS